MLVICVHMHLCICEYHSLRTMGCLQGPPWGTAAVASRRRRRADERRDSARMMDGVWIGLNTYRRWSLYMLSRVVKRFYMRCFFLSF